MNKIKYGFCRFVDELSQKSDYWHLRMPTRLNPEEWDRTYYLDMSGKGTYPGEMQNGIPVFYYDGIYPTFFHTTIFNYGLGLLERRAQGEDIDESLQQVLTYMQQTQDESGEWVYHFDPAIHPLLENHVSGMTQGLAISLAVRCMRLGLLDTAIGNKMIASAKQNMLQHCVGKHFGCTIIEEHFAPGNGTLNGGLFALLGLRDYAVWTQDFEDWEYYEQEFRHVLPAYSFGHWSFYDAQHTLTSGFYQQLHIDLVNVLGAITHAPEYQSMAQKWTKGLHWNSWYTLLKGVQKLLHIRDMEMSYANRQ
ncbi:MAG: D-glucuronyl C5-epimerase family protein [Paludibacteraceae bacterium]|nr:D-glucuronyl C5-epimerase family protein [Paludibacteraceae bacterium]